MHDGVVNHGQTKVAVARVVAAIGLALAPVVVTAASPWSAVTGVIVLGMMPTMSAAAAGSRAMVASTVASVATAFVAVLFGSAGGCTPVLGALLVMLLAQATGRLSPRGLHPIGAATIAIAAYLLVDPSSVLGALGDSASPLAAAGLVSGLVAISCGWVVAVSACLLPKPRSAQSAAGDQLGGQPAAPGSVPVAPAPVGVEEAATTASLPYSTLLAGVCGILTLICLLWLPGTNSWWAVLTAAVILQPTRGDTRARLLGRIVGTVLGGTTAALLVLVLPSGWLPALGLASALATIALLLTGAAYWKYSLAVTVTVILTTFQPGAALAGDLQRVLVTVAAAGVTAGAVWVSSRLAPASAQPSGNEEATLG